MSPKPKTTTWMSEKDDFIYIYIYIYFIDDSYLEKADLTKLSERSNELSTVGLYFKSLNFTISLANSCHFERYIFNAGYGSRRFETDEIPRSDHGYNYSKDRIEFNFRIIMKHFHLFCS